MQREGALRAFRNRRVECPRRTTIGGSPLEPLTPSPPPAPAPGRLTRFALGPHLEAIALATVLVLAAGARAVEALRVPLWFDEIYTLWIARLGPHGLTAALRSDVHPPLHELLVWAWWRLGGESELWLRSLSIVFGVATVAALYGLARDLFGRAPALAAALLLALHRTHVYFSQELRSYGLLWLLYTLSLWQAWRFVRGGRGAAIAYAAAGAAALYTHYQTGLFLPFVALWGAVALARTPRRLAAWVALHVAIAVAFVPQVPTFLAQLARNQSHWVTAPHAHDLIDLFRAYAFGMRLLIVPLVALMALPLARRGERAGAALLWCGTFPLIALSYVATQRGAHLFTERYMDFAVPAVCALAAAGILGVRWKAVAIAGALALALAAAVSLARHQPLEEPRELELARADLASRVGPGDVIVHADTHSLLFFVQHAPARASQRILIAGPPLPYYEGTGVIPDSLFLTAPEFDSLRATGTRWWGVRTHHVGFDTRPALDSLRAHAASIRHFGPLVTVIEGAR